MLGVKPSDHDAPMTRVFEGAALADGIVQIDDRLDLVPADASLPDVVHSLYSMRKREEVLARQLAVTSSTRSPPWPPSASPPAF